MKSVKIALILVLLPACNLALSAAIPAAERQALIDLYNSTNGDVWTNKTGWKTPPLHTDGFALPGTENTWFGITADTGNTTVTRISMGKNNLVGTLPVSLGNLNHLQDITLHSNQLSGSIPVEFGNLSALQELLLWGNNLVGGIPTELGALGNLRRIWLYDNQLSGSIPVSLGSLSNLYSLCLERNQLSGSIPAQLGNLSQLLALYLDSNQLTGSIPAELGNLGSLLYLSLPSNQLTGSIPTELGNLSNLTTLSLFLNQLTGNIPESLGLLNKLVFVDLGGNKLSGSIPVEIGNLINLQELYLYSNQLSGSFPTSLTNLTKLISAHTDFGYNALHASDPALITFLNSKDADWAATQTIAPTNVTAVSGSSTSVNVSWTPIPYTGDMGGYRVFVSTTLGGPYDFFAQTTTKLSSSQLVTGLTPGTPYYFVVQSRTDAHTFDPSPQNNNQNILDSENSSEATATTASGAPEINLKQGTTDIATGGMYGFGTKAIGTDTDAVFAIQNIGNADLTLTGLPLIIIGTDADQFSITVQPMSPVAPAGSRNFSVRFHPTGAGAKTAQISIANNDFDENPYIIDLTGSGSDSSINPGDLYAVDTVVGNLRYIPSGTFTQGSPSSEVGRFGNETQFRHVLTLNLAVMETEVTRQMWADLKSAQPSLPVDPSNNEISPGLSYPVQFVSWYEAVLFANLLSLQEGFERCYYTDAEFATPITAANYNTGPFYCNFSANGFRLPTEGEWEYFTRAGTTTPFSIDEPLFNSSTSNSCIPNALPSLESVAWFCANSASQLHPVGMKLGNPWNMRDVHGNSDEWCWDIFGPYPTESVIDYRGLANGSSRALRGGRWRDEPYFSRSAYRFNSGPGEAYDGLGFRLLRALPSGLGTLSLVFPNGGESLPIGTNQNITWTSTGTIANVRIEYSTNNGSAWSDIIASTANDGIYPWPIPNTASNQCLVRVSDAVNAAVNDASNAIFSINVSSTITVNSPNGGESWMGGSVHNITWNSSGTVGNVKLEYSTNNGANWTTIIVSTTNDGTEPWTLPFTPSSQYLVRVSDAGNAAIFDDSNAAFTVIGDGTEPNNDSASAAILPLGTTGDLMFTVGDIDWYKFFVPASEAGKDLKVNVRVTSPYPNPLPAGWRSDLDFDLLDGALNVRGIAISGSDNETLYLPNVASGWYYIDIPYCTTVYADSTDYARYSVSLETGTNFGLGYLSGRVVDGLGQGIENVFVRMYTSPNFVWDASFPTMTTGPGGVFCLAYEPGTYALYFTGDGTISENQPAVNIVDEYYRDKKTLGTADLLSLANGQTLNLGDVALDIGAIVTGRVTNSSGTALANVFVYGYDSEGRYCSSVRTDGSGNYSLSRVPVGGAKLSFSRSGYAFEYYNDRPSFGSGDLLATQSGGTIPNIDAQPTNGGMISGNVSNGQGTGLTVPVKLFSVLDATYSRATATPDALGNYNLYNVKPGDYKVLFNAAGTAYASEWYTDAASFATATTITVTEGNATTGINGVLAAPEINLKQEQPTSRPAGPTPSDQRSSEPIPTPSLRLRTRGRTP